MDRNETECQLLNPSQKNALRISLLLVEKGMLEIEHLLSAGEHQGILLRVTDDLGEDTKRGIRQHIDEVRGVIRELKERFQLGVEVEEKRPVIFGKAPILWEIVTDTDASRLRGYGEIHPGLKEALDPLIGQLSLSLLKLHQLVAHPDSPR